MAAGSGAAAGGEGWRWAPRWILAALLALALAAVVEAAVGWREVLRPWRTLEPTALLGALAAVLASYALRAARIRDALLPGGGPFGPCLRLTLQHNLLNNLLPMRSGELSFPWLAARLLGVPPGRSVPALLWLRLLDLHTLGLLALPALAALGLPAWAAAALALAWLPLPLLARALTAGSARRLAGRGGRPARLLLALEAALPQGRGALLRSLAWSWAAWGAKLAAFAWVLGRFVEAPAPALVAGAVGGDLTSVLPVHGLAGAGTYEAGVVAALLPFGVAPAAALAGAVNLHLFLLGAALLGGALALLPGRRRRG